MNPIQFLNYGLLGLCGLIVFLFWRVMDREQSRQGSPRKKIIHFSWIFIFLALVLAAAGLTLELFRLNHDVTAAAGCDGTVNPLKTELEKQRIYVATLEERVTAKMEVIRRLDVTLSSLGEKVAALPTVANATVPITRGEQVRSVEISLPQNRELKDTTLSTLKEAHKLVSSLQ